MAVTTTTKDVIIACDTDTGKRIALCPKCYTIVENDARFCTNCGQNFTSPASIPTTTTIKGVIVADNLLGNYQKFALAVEQLAEFMSELRGKAASDDAVVGTQCFEITNELGGVEKVCYSIPHGKNKWNSSLEFLTKRLTAAFLPPPTVPVLMRGNTEPIVPGEGMFDYLAPILGFFNFVPSYEDRDGGMNDRLIAFCVNTFNRLHELATLSKGDWQQLYEAATYRAYNRLKTRLYRGAYSHSEPYSGSSSLFSYRRLYSYADLPNSTASFLVKQIVAGEESRLAAFLAALQSTLQVLPAVGALYQDQGISPPEDAEHMIDFLYRLHSVLTGTVGQEALLSPFSTIGAVTVVNSEPTAQDNVVDLCRQAQAKEEELVQAQAELCTANQQIEELKNQLALLKPQVMVEQALGSYYDYKRRLREAASRERVNGVWPQWEIGFDQGYITTLVYSFDPSAVAFSLRELDDVEAGKRRAISKEAFLHFAGVVGYPNFYQYLLQSKSALLEKLCDLAVPATEIPGVYVLDDDAALWLGAHRPPFVKRPNTPCYVILRTYSEYIGREIIPYEKQSLLDFRQSLCMAVSLLAPVLPEEPDQPALPQGRDQQVALLQVKDKRIAELEWQVAKLASQVPIGPKARIKDTHKRNLHVHYYELEINDKENGVSQPIQVAFAVNDEGKLIPMEEEEA